MITQTQTLYFAKKAEDLLTKGELKPSIEFILRHLPDDHSRRKGFVALLTQYSLLEKKQKDGLFVSESEFRRITSWIIEELELLKKEYPNQIDLNLDSDTQKLANPKAARLNSATKTKNKFKYLLAIPLVIILVLGYQFYSKKVSYDLPSVISAEDIVIIQKTTSQESAQAYLDYQKEDFPDLKLAILHCPHESENFIVFTSFNNLKFIPNHRRFKWKEAFVHKEKEFVYEKSKDEIYYERVE